MQRLLMDSEALTKIHQHIFISPKNKNTNNQSNSPLVHIKMENKQTQNLQLDFSSIYDKS